MQGFAPRKHPAPGLQPGLHRKTTFCFSASPAGKTATLNILQHPARSLPAPSDKHLSGPIPYRALHFPTATTYLRQPASKLPPPHLFIPAPQSSVSQQPSFRFDRPAYFRSHSFFSFSFLPPTSTLFSQQKKETDFADFPLFFFFLTTPTQASPSLSLSLPFSPSSQYTLLHRLRSGYT